MKINNQRIFEGRNIYSHRKCIRLDVDLEGYCETPTKDIDGFNERLLSYVPELYTHRCGIDIEGGFVQRLKEGTYLAHVCEHTIIGIHNKLGIDIKYGKAREIKDDFYYIIFKSFLFDDNTPSFIILATSPLSFPLKSLSSFITMESKKSPLILPTSFIVFKSLSPGTPIIPVIFFKQRFLRESITTLYPSIL